jgi:hypothetical protein
MTGFSRIHFVTIYICSKMTITAFRAAIATSVHTSPKNGAEEGIRTLDIHLGKVTLYP